MLAPELSEEIIGLAEVRDVFRSPKFGAIAGCMVVEGIVSRNQPIRVLRDDIVIFESTVYPGVTRNVCVPELEKLSGLIFNKDFYCGYSPERINPGDNKYKLIKKQRAKLAVFHGSNTLRI